MPRVDFEWIAVTLPGGCEPGWYPAYTPGSHEFVVVVPETLRLRATRPTSPPTCDTVAAIPAQIRAPATLLPSSCFPAATRSCIPRVILLLLGIFDI